MSIQGQYFKDKTIAKSWQFVVEFFNTEIFKEIKPYHIVDVAVPFYNFAGNTTMYGSIPQSFTSLSMENPLQLSITFEEDNKGTITKLIHTLQKRIVRPSGVHNPIYNQSVGGIMLSVIRDNANVDNYYGTDQFVMMYEFFDCKYLGVDNSVSLAYSSSDTIKYKIEFSIGSYKINTTTSFGEKPDASEGKSFVEELQKKGKDGWFTREGEINTQIVKNIEYTSKVK